jgi:hypothetical protein
MSTSSADLDLAVPVQTRNNKKVMMARRRKLVTSSATEQTTTLESSTGPQVVLTFILIVTIEPYSMQGG